MLSQLPKVALVGRPNVGKSTLFNRLVGRRQAIVDDIPGVTRDRQYGQVDWAGQSFTIIDTGGFIPGAEKHDLAKAIQNQVMLGLEESDLVILVVDGRQGLTPAEEEIGRLLRAQRANVVVAVNKVDQSDQEGGLGEFYGLGFKHTIPVSAESGRGVGDFLDELLTLLQQVPTREAKAQDYRLTILGQPNVGKSTLLNALLGTERAVVHPEAGTTLDPIRIQQERGSRIWEFIDTAGIRKRRQTKGKMEKVGFIKSLQSVDQSDLVLLVVDVTKGLTSQDAKILKHAEDKGKGMVLVLNKWDLAPKDFRLKDFKTTFQEKFPRQRDIPLIAISAKTKRGINRLFNLMEQVLENYHRRIGTGEINRVFQEAVNKNPPPTVSGQNINLSYVTQSNTAPPRFVIFANHPKLVPENYLRYLENTFRKNFSFSGTPLIWKLRRKK